MGAVPTTTSSDEFAVRAAGPLQGAVVVNGAKNSALKLMAASLLAEGRTRLRNVPAIADVPVMAELLRHDRLAPNAKASTGQQSVDGKRFQHGKYGNAHGIVGPCPDGDAIDAAAGFA